MIFNQAWSCIECINCHGTGYVDVPPLQDGGWVSVEKCSDCGGSGEQKKYRDSHRQATGHYDIDR